MTDYRTIKSEFLQEVVAAIEEGMQDEHFGVSELASQMNMSRSNLLRRVKKITNLSVSLLIRQVRLRHAQELLEDDTLTISEVGYKVGFNSPSYFIKCFKEQYGYPPGAQAQQEADPHTQYVHAPTNKSKAPLILALVSLALVGAALFWWLKRPVEPKVQKEKSIAVLPFINDSGDASNTYVVNGLMEAILNNLQKIEDIRVVSRTSTEKYRSMPTSMSQISQELEVNYVVEGSGQKSGNQIVLTVQLIEASRDQHLWSKRYTSETQDIFQLQAEVAKDIALEQDRIEKILTENLRAYDLYLKGLEWSKTETAHGLDSAIKYFKEALVEDPEFAQANAYVAICYYYSDLFKKEKQYGEEINNYADRAVLLDAELPESLIAKGLFYMQDDQYERAVEYLERVLQYNPNSGWANNFLTDIYHLYLPDSKKYLKHALQGIKLDLANQDSSTTSITYLHLSNALAQNGFLEQAEYYINKSIEYDSSNIFSAYVWAYVRLAQDENWELAISRLKQVLVRDTSRVDVIQELAKLCYSTKEYQQALAYYRRYLFIKNSLQLDIYPSEDLKIAFVLQQQGFEKEAEEYYQAFKAYAEQDQSKYHHLSLAAYYAANKMDNLALEHLEKFSHESHYIYWIVLFMKDDPIFEHLQEDSRYLELMDKINQQFWQDHEDIKEVLIAEELI